MEKCGIKVDKDALDALFKTMEKTTVTEAIEKGSSKFISMPAGGGGGAAVASSAAAGGAAEPEKKEEEKKEEEEDVEMGNLFGDDDDY